ncbi:MAG: SAM-dependent methyltransferase [bacterium]|nr:SAM-dependent methyltransferase [bacterium]
MQLKNIVPWGRSLEEYIRMFSLTDDDLKKNILGCGDGPASFNAELSAKGGNIVSIDPVYEFSSTEIKTRIDETYHQIVSEVYKKPDNYIWNTFSNVEELVNTRMNSMNKFLSDYKTDENSDRYKNQSLPNLTFRESEFDLALCSHFLFLYSDHIDVEIHISSMIELCRVAKEVRVYPLVTLNCTPSPYIEKVIHALSRHGIDASLVEVDYHFQKGATQMLVAKSI